MARGPLLRHCTLNVLVASLGSALPVSVDACVVVEAAHAVRHGASTIHIFRNVEVVTVDVLPGRVRLGLLRSPPSPGSDIFQT